MADQVEDISKTVDELNELLLKGRVSYWMARNEVLDVKSSKSIEEKIDRVMSELNEWRTKVVDMLTLHAPSKQQLFHFVQHRGSSYSLINVNLELSNRLMTFESYLYALEDVIIRIEDFRNLQIRREIAEKEYQTDILYKITYSTHTREVKLNDIVLTKTDFDSENDNCFNYIYENPNRPINIDELESVAGGKVKKRIAHIVRDLGFIKELKTIFFPVVTKSQVKFVNPITKQYFYKNNLPPINFRKLGDKVSQSKTK